MFRSMCLCAPCHPYVLRSMLVAIPCASKALPSLNISLSYVLSPFPLYVYVCLLAFMLFLHVSLSRSRPCHALCPPWICLYGYIFPSYSSFGCNHLWDTPPWCWCAWFTLFFTPSDVDMLALLALCHPFGFLCFFASLPLCIFACLPTCLCINLCVVHTPIQRKYEHLIQTYIFLPKTPPFVW